MTSQLVHVETHDGVRTITINRPDAYNSLNQELRLALRDAFAAAAADAGAPRARQDGETPAVRAVILRAEGKAFCSGQDLKEQLAHMKSGAGMDKVVNEYNPMMAALLSIPVPVIAEIAGPAAGAGWALAMACDLRFMSTAASFKAAFTGVGLAADSGLSESLVQRLGRSKALELLLLDEKISADKAQQLDLVAGVVKPEELHTVVSTVASKFAKGPTAAYKEMKQLVSRPHGVEEAAAAEAKAQERLAETADHLEAITAFVEKRPANYRGI
ncbi:enoyl-CoA hydratase/isomerase family protein [uncultured Corynebacterium sp.]|uniref:enoyl-CoA hydratase/isomerase family protein n=1 Tax=uncultured Corynebacterium sp. TaxID=159447 RepID=UPI0025E356DE|nr:enoyl-CoA hydratase-related protein [uncultured Corynebacterium sp.]